MPKERFGSKSSNVYKPQVKALRRSQMEHLLSLSGLKTKLAVLIYMSIVFLNENPGTLSAELGGLSEFYRRNRGFVLYSRTNL